MNRNRALVIVAVVSVGLNLILVGVLLGRMAGPSGARPMDPLIGARRMLTELPDDRAAALAPYFRAFLSALRPRFREIRGAQRELRSAMLTDPLDEAALSTALTRFHSQLTDSQQAAREAFVALAGAMTLEERRQLVDRMGEPPHRGDRMGPDRPPHDRLPPGPPPEARPPP